MLELRNIVNSTFKASFTAVFCVSNENWRTGENETLLLDRETLTAACFTPKFPGARKYFPNYRNFPESLVKYLVSRKRLRLDDPIECSVNIMQSYN